MKLFFIDTETTGTNPAKHGLIQIGGIIEIDGKEIDRINILSAPYPDDVIEQEALNVNNRTEEEIRAFTLPQLAYRKFVEILNDHVNKYDRSDKFHFIGYNATFDEDFLRAWFRKAGNAYYGSYFFWPPIDVANLAAYHFMKRRHVFKDFKLMTVASAAGIQIDEEKAYDAMYDIEITRELFYCLELW